MNKSYAFFPGCSSHGTSREMDMSTRAVCEAAGIALEEMKGWVCCGATPVHAIAPNLALSLSAKNLAIAQSMKMDVAVTCAACFNRMKSAEKHLGEDAALLEKINRISGAEYGGTVKVRHTLTILKDLGAEGLSSLIKKKLEGLSVACYYGCLLLRPPKVTEFDDPENPSIMESLISAAGATPVDWNFRTECCGASFSVPEPQIVYDLGNKILSDAKKHGADVIAVACPLCQMNLDMRQREIEAKSGVQYRLPIVYLMQLLGLAMGLPPEKLGLGKLIVSPMAVLREKNIA